jgi:hypothetical protein
MQGPCRSAMPSARTDPDRPNGVVGKPIDRKRMADAMERVLATAAAASRA